MKQVKSHEILRSGFLKDGRFYSIEAGRLKGGAWGAWIVCVPGQTQALGDESRTIKAADRREFLRRWVKDLAESDIEGLAETHCA
ncbi:MAG: hypothetical protein AMS25_00070 [Gemmatimonas sp. SM23_52]|nr:MAG: hypothetical protein AMS25_00070 [Gemmatimonas sp. SM23_52]